MQLGYATDTIIQQLLARYKQGDMIVRSVALRALGLLQAPPPEVISLLLAAAQRKANPFTRCNRTPAHHCPADPQWTALFFGPLEAEGGASGERRSKPSAL
ncbi:MAG: hypothetical protein R2867_18355 [Caldilineaceae bacterium]